MSAKASRPVLKTSRAGDRPAESTAPAGHQALGGEALLRNAGLKRNALKGNETPVGGGEVTSRPSRASLEATRPKSFL